MIDWTRLKRELILSSAWVGGMTTLYCGGYWLAYGHLPPWVR